MGVLPFQITDYQLFMFENSFYLFYFCQVFLNTKTVKNKTYTITKSRAMPIRLTPIEMTIIQLEMKRDGWTNVSGFLKYKLFGRDYRKETDENVASKDSEAVGSLLLNATLELANQVEFLIYRYNRDLQQLFREEGTDWNKWAKATKPWHNTMLAKTEEALTLIRRICEVLNIREYFDLPSDSMNIDPDNATKEEMDALAAQLQKERIAMGHLDIDE